jgi:hypothetical protein
METDIRQHRDRSGCMIRGIGAGKKALHKLLTHPIPFARHLDPGKLISNSRKLIPNSMNSDKSLTQPECQDPHL